MTHVISSHFDTWQEINGKQEPIITFLITGREHEADFMPFPRENDITEQYSYAESRLKMMGYSSTDFDKEIMQIHKAGEKDPVFCRTAEFVGMCKATWGDENFAQCIEQMFVASNGARATGAIVTTARKLKAAE